MENAEKSPRQPGRPPKTAPPSKTLNQVTVHLPPELVAALDSEWEETGLRSRSELIREACQSYLKQHQEQAQSLSLTRRMRDLPKEERRKIMAAAAESLSGYYRTDLEIQEWQVLETEDFYDIGK